MGAASRLFVSSFLARCLAGQGLRNVTLCEDRARRVLKGVHFFVPAVEGLLCNPGFDFTKLLAAVRVIGKP